MKVGENVIITDWSWALAFDNVEGVFYKPNNFNKGKIHETVGKLVLLKPNLPGELDSKNDCAVYCKGELIFTNLRFLKPVDDEETKILYRTHN